MRKEYMLLLLLLLLNVFWNLSGAALIQIATLIGHGSLRGWLG